MKKKFLVLLLCSVALVSILLTPTLIADDDDDEAIRASGEWKYDIASFFKTAMTDDGSMLIYADADEEWTGTLKGTSYDIWSGVVHPSGVFDAQGRSEFEGTVRRKKGTLVMLWVGTNPGYFAGGEDWWEGHTVILSGTGKLENLRGRFEWWGPSGDLDYSGEIYFIDDDYDDDDDD